jgi:hypothetical protein
MEQDNKGQPSAPNNSEWNPKEQGLTFERELESLINKYGIERGSDTPDFLIAEYMSNCLIAYQQVVTKRDKWFGVDMWAVDKISAQRKSEK